MFIIGLTGGISTGKTTVSEMFQEYGIPVIDADKMARKGRLDITPHRLTRPVVSCVRYSGNRRRYGFLGTLSDVLGDQEVVEPGKPAWKKIKKEFGDTVFHPTGELNREVLGEIIFDDVNKRRALNEITHPEIYKEMFWEAVKCFFQGHQFVVMDLPLLFESGSMLDYLYKIIVVSCEEDIQLVRLIERGNLTETHAKKRIAAQMALDVKCGKAQYVIENSGSIEDTREQVTRIVAALKSSNHHWKMRLIAGLFCSGIVSFIIWLGTKTYQNKFSSQ